MSFQSHHKKQYTHPLVRSCACESWETNWSTKSPKNFKKKINILIDSKDLVLKTDLLIGEKLLDEGKQLGLIGKVRAVRRLTPEMNLAWWIMRFPFS